MVFLRWVRAGVLTLSVVVSAAVLALSAALIYSRSTETLWYSDGDTDDFFIRRSIHPSFDMPDSSPGDPPMGGFDALAPSGHDIDTVLTTSVAIINILTVPILLLADLFKRKTWVSTLVVEASWLLVLWSLWLTCGAYTAWCSQANVVNFVRCQFSASQCMQYKFVEVLSFVNWIALMLYTNTLFTLAVINHLRHYPIWLERVRDAPRLPPVVFASPPALHFDEGKAHSLTLSTSSSSLLHQHMQQVATARYLQSHGHFDVNSPVLPSIDESAAPCPPPPENPAHVVAHPNATSALPPLYTERPSHMPV